MYEGQWLQDKYLDEEVFRGKTNGVFVDIGCADPKHMSNSYMLEVERGWTGLCIDARKAVIEECAQVRKATAINCAIGATAGAEMFLEFGVLSGMPRYFSRFEYDQIARYSHTEGPINAYWVQVRRFSDILAEHNISKIDLLCMDVEGAERAILETIDFDAIDIEVLVIESNSQDSLAWVREFMSGVGYAEIQRLGQDSIFRKRSAIPQTA